MNQQCECWLSILVNITACCVDVPSSYDCINFAPLVWFHLSGHFCLLLYLWCYVQFSVSYKVCLEKRELHKKTVAVDWCLLPLSQFTATLTSTSKLRKLPLQWDNGWKSFRVFFFFFWSANQTEMRNLTDKMGFIFNPLHVWSLIFSESAFPTSNLRISSCQTLQSSVNELNGREMAVGEFPTWNSASEVGLQHEASFKNAWCDLWNGWQ